MGHARHFLVVPRPRLRRLHAELEQQHRSEHELRGRPSQTQPQTQTQTADAVAPVIGKASYAKPAAAELKTRLSRLQYEVTQNAATEPPFRNAYYDNHEAGIYVDVVTGEPLFSSLDKFESGTGWPSFTKAIEPNRVVEHSDATLGMERVEVTSKAGSSHLGHVFDDGPAPTHQRFCINSASLRFIPVAKLAAEGYGDYAKLFGVKTTSADVLPPATDNSCALPPPGTKAGCNSDYQTVIFAAVAGDPKPSDGVLDVVHGFEGPSAAVEVTFDPAKISYEQLLVQWTKGREKQSTVFTTDEAQKRVATAKAIAVKDAKPFVRR